MRLAYCYFASPNDPILFSKYSKLWRAMIDFEFKKDEMLECPFPSDGIAGIFSSSHIRLLAVVFCCLRLNGGVSESCDEYWKGQRVQCFRI